MSKKLRITVTFDEDTKLQIPVAASATIGTLLVETKKRYARVLARENAKEEQEQETGHEILYLTTEDGAELFEEDAVEDVLEDKDVLLAVHEGPVRKKAKKTPRKHSTKKKKSKEKSPSKEKAVKKKRKKGKGRLKDEDRFISYKTVEGEITHIYDSSFDLNSTSLEELSKAIVLNEGMNPHKVSCQFYLFEHALIPDSTTQTKPLREWGIGSDDLLFVNFISNKSLQSNPSGWEDVFAMRDWWKPWACEQNEKGMSVFLSSLMVVISELRSSAYSSKKNHLFAQLRHMLPFPPTVNAFAYLCTRPTFRVNYMPAISNGFYWLFRNFLPKEHVKNNQVFEHSRECWTYLLDNIDESVDTQSEVFVDISLSCPLSFTRLDEPVEIPGVQDQFVSKPKLEEKLSAGESYRGLDEGSELKISPYCCKLLLAHPGMTSVYVFRGAKTIANNEPINIFKTFDWNTLIRKANQHTSMKVVAPLSLKSSSPPVLTWYSDENMVVFTSRSKDVNLSCNIYHPIKGKNQQVDPNQLATALNNLSGQMSSSSVTDNREPKEAIIVLLDVSYSMEANWENQLTRMQAVKQLFHAFANRSTAYDYPHHIALLLFGTRVDYVCSFTPNFDVFKTHVNDAQPEGTTALYNALWKGSNLLKEYQQTYPDCKLRMLCLTDGDDTASTTTPIQVAQSIRENGITVDAVLITEDHQMELKAISTYSGGLCFHPTGIEEAVKLFELEAVLSVRSRRKQEPKPKVNTEQKLLGYSNLSRYPYDVSPQRKQPKLIRKKVTSAQRSLQQAAKMKPPSTANQKMGLIKRVLQELQSLTKNPHPAFHIFPCEENFSFWRMLLEGPADTPYANGVFVLYVSFPDEYPAKAPEMRFITPIYHCNINRDGKICHSVFDRNWTSETSMSTVLSCVYGLLLVPEPDDPLDSTLAEEYHADRAAYLRKARSHTMTHASKSLEERKAREMLGNEEPKDNGRNDNEELEHLTCPLTHELFEDPVSTKYGHTYSRKAIEKWLETHDTDPLTKNPLTMDDLAPNYSIRKAVECQVKMQKTSREWWND